jgi:hypothetical protein
MSMELRLLARMAALGVVPEFALARRGKAVPNGSNT